jgi:hypothetical protein
MARLCVLTVVICALAGVGTAATPSVTFHKDVLPILPLMHARASTRSAENLLPFSLFCTIIASFLRSWARARLGLVSLSVRGLCTRIFCTRCPR